MPFIHRMSFVPGYIRAFLSAWGRPCIENGTFYPNDARVLGLTLSEEAIEKFGTRVA